MLHLGLASMALQYSGLAHEGDAVQPAFIGHEDDVQSLFADEEDDVLSDTDYELPKAQERMLSVSLSLFFFVCTTYIIKMCQWLHLKVPRFKQILKEASGI